MQIDYRWVQSRLRALGFDPGPIDGVRGPRTDAAVRAFKRSVGLRDRAFIGPITLAALRPVERVPADRHIPWMAEASAIMGLHESRDTSRLRHWFDRSVAWIDPREIPWCGAFVATCLRKWQPDIQLPENPLGARSWAGFGKPCAPVFGSVMTFWRGSRDGWQGHVGFNHGEDETHFHILGGNQANAVTVTRISKSRFLQSRWPIGFQVVGQRIAVTPGGIPVSSNEA